MDILDILYSNKDSLMSADYSDLIQNILNNKELPSNERSRLTKSATAHARKADLDRGTLDSIKKRFISFDVETTVYFVILISNFLSNGNPIYWQI